MLEDVLLSFSIQRHVLQICLLIYPATVLNLINNGIGYVITLTIASNKAYCFLSNTPQSILLQFALRAQW